MAVQVPPRRRICGTKEAADRTGYSQRHIRLMADRGEIWSQKISERMLVVDADEIARLAIEREQLRRAGKLGGRRPGDKRTA